MRPAPALGAAAGLALLVLVAVPYVLADSGAVSVYYGVGVLGPPILAAFVGVALVALLSGAAGRSDRSTASGVAVALAGFVLVLGLSWAIAARVPAGGMEAGEVLDIHRWAFVGAALVFLGASSWEARSAL